MHGGVHKWLHASYDKSWWSQYSQFLLFLYGTILAFCFILLSKKLFLFFSENVCVWFYCVIEAVLVKKVKWMFYLHKCIKREKSMCLLSSIASVFLFIHSKEKSNEPFNVEPFWISTRKSKDKKPHCGWVYICAKSNLIYRQTCIRQPL